MYFVYILRCSDGSLYVGVSDDPNRRLSEHAAGRGSNFTASRLPVELIWTESHPSLCSARTRENQLKRWTHAKKQALIDGTIDGSKSEISLREISS